MIRYFQIQLPRNDVSIIIIEESLMIVANIRFSSRWYKTTQYDQNQYFCQQRTHESISECKYHNWQEVLHNFVKQE